MNRFAIQYRTCTNIAFIFLAHAVSSPEIAFIDRLCALVLVQFDGMIGILLTLIAESSAICLTVSGVGGTMNTGAI